MFFHTQIYSELNQNQSLRFLDPLGSLLDGCAVDEATAAAASPAFMCGAVLLPLTDILVCQVSRTRALQQQKLCFLLQLAASNFRLVILPGWQHTGRTILERGAAGCAHRHGSTTV